MKTDVSSRRETHFFLSAEAKNTPEKLPEIKKNPSTMERKIDMLLRFVFFGFWNNFGILNWSKLEEKAIGVDPRSVSETIVVPRNLFEAPGDRFWSPEDSILEALGHFFAGLWASCWCFL